MLSRRVLLTSFSILLLSSCLTRTEFPIATKEVSSKEPADRSIASKPELRTFRMRLSGEPQTLDWTLAHTTKETYLLMNLMEGLVEVDPSLKVRPRLARTWSVSKDGLLYTFSLRDGIEWSDGKKLSAKDFYYSWKRLLSPSTAASYAYLLFDIVGAEAYHLNQTKDFSKVGIRVIDETTLQVVLKKPVAHWIYFPTFWPLFPLREDIVNRHGQSWARPGKMVNLGPFLLDTIRGKQIILKSNPRYHDRAKRGNVQRVVAEIIEDDKRSFEKFEKGELDLLTGLGTLAENQISKHPNLRRFPYLKTGYLGFATSQHPTNNKDLRNAIASAIDRKALVKELFGGQKAAGSFVPPPLPAHDRKMGPKFNPKLSKRILRKLGIEPFSALKVDILVENAATQRRVAGLVAKQLEKNMGIRTSVRTFDHRSFRAQLDLKTFPLFVGYWGADFPDPDNFLSVFLSSSGNNRTAWKNKLYDEKVILARSLINRRERWKTYREAQKILLEKDFVIFPLYYEPNRALVQNKVKGLILDPLNYLFLRKVSFGP